MDDRWITDWEPSERFPVYTRANAGEILPNPVSPLGWDLIWEEGVSKGWADGAHRQGVFTPEESNPDQPDYIACFGGYLYLNASMIRINGERTPGLSAEAMDAAFLGNHPDVPPYIAQEGDQRPELIEKIEEVQAWVMSLEELPEELAEDREKILSIRAQRPDLSTASDDELVERARSLKPLVREFFEPYQVYGTMSATGPTILGALCGEIDPALPGRLISGLGGIDSAPPSIDMWELSRKVNESEELTSAFDAGVAGLMNRLANSESGNAFLNDFSGFLAEHGARGPYEWDAASETWEVKPASALAAIDAMRHADESLSPTNRHAAAVADREAAEQEVREILAGNDEALATLDLGMRTARVFIAGRERTKLTSMLTNHEIRLPMYELGRRMTERGVLSTPGEVFLLREMELDSFIDDPEQLTDLVKQRAKDFAALSTLQDPFIVNGVVPPLSDWGERGIPSQPADAGEELAGVPGSPGIVTGKARVVTDPSDPQGLEPGEILVAPITDPSWTPLFIPAAGVVVEVGAPLSHSVIVSREFGIPCVTGVFEAVSKIPNGAIISINGVTGTVTIAELPE
ncbi:MAG: PEP-utilizing enzyme [Acidimicrobiales bacterium]|jgi:pyruvate,water dikinase|nr:PEP-utilizing enzyme [Acidimicrobiales bacterium]MDP6299355.1 PEP-utilizing enzyme [Acidimicrobiales bacterium]HJM27661.1 PEP-utilizing enzyme [Acidimicrobiales bacterium]HJM97503.1 PEP-utilizing enzyme [Acidimicrobiales bacterium]